MPHNYLFNEVCNTSCIATPLIHFRKVTKRYLQLVYITIMKNINHCCFMNNMEYTIWRTCVSTLSNALPCDFPRLSLMYNLVWNTWGSHYQEFLQETIKILSSHRFGALSNKHMPMHSILDPKFWTSKIVNPPKISRKNNEHIMRSRTHICTIITSLASSHKKNQVIHIIINYHFW